MDITLAAFKLAHLAGGGEQDLDDDEEKPKLRKPISSAPGAAGAPAPAAKQEPAKPAGPPPGTKMGRVYIGMGRLAEILPQNITGAITAEGMKGSMIGTIEINDKYSVVELPDNLIEEALRVLKNGTIKGKKFVSRRFVEKA